MPFFATVVVLRSTLYSRGCALLLDGSMADASLVQFPQAPPVAVAASMLGRGLIVPISGAMVSNPQ